MNQETSEYLSDIITLLLDAVCVVDSKGTLLFANPAFESIFGYAPEEAINRQMLDFVYPEDRAKTIQAINKIVSSNDDPRFENRWVRKDGRIVHVLWSVYWSKEKQVRVAIAYDITEQKKLEQKLIYMAGHDSLTDLPNRHYLTTQLEESLSIANTISTVIGVLFIDIDGFKQVNDIHGHGAGDKLLKTIAMRIRHVLKKGDSVGRLGGDEFVVVLKSVKNKNDVIEAVDKLKAEICKPLIYNDAELIYSPSIGAVLFPEHYGDAEYLIQCADKAMYNAKYAGGNQVVFYNDTMTLPGTKS
ncbi:diguanylate cyclase domain-containing protein [Pseudoalteromonas sp. SSMSWG5]|jgi:diguanylate cyclase (GGDEF)-like protein/PAS domain S-box-containing protein|uniref:sensor domain-containing diguanylate cyclase n=2 Tax=Pseudoalteromonas TaxID=53246 RepID=UPI000C3C43E0|nr:MULTISPECIES: GGDEF domain-containing protein [unclassified Pseudoalteromonas]MBU77260.1 diguanylate cyclase [Pseudoalteromonadaceae bacterium]HCV02818.1 diguanylate cyclase [Pseudoalteromonas sp.]MCF2899595.1 GGDEF domain-containing protein [Pseudoalteromonas sp. OFAV1]MCF2921405.1 GGDEF domain-containing protein [Pseudoalteromonas sp. APAL1]MCO7249809.1 GGDEF domain-containing protein [Pseudoalteromonas sp. Ps84H-4]|tara:strand:+ start:4425 stop:5327 length:903 start_codon:yes stop_codon:yes gene_type:complete